MKTYRVTLAFALALTLLMGGYFLFHHHSNQTDPDTEEASAYQSALFAGLAATSTPQPATSATPQFVILSFDGSKSVDMLNETLAFEDSMRARGIPLHFTYFINAAYFLTNSTASLYTAPGEQPGVSKIGFSNNASDIAARVQAFNTAYTEGNEIGSHSVGHFDGTRWSKADWGQEFASFATLMANIQKNNPSVPIASPTFLGQIVGFRAPVLGVNDHLYEVERASHFSYDSSTVALPQTWPHQDSLGIWHIPLGTLFIGPTKSPTVAMDYSIWMHQSHGKSDAAKGTALWNTYFTDTKAAYLDYFNTNYQGNRAPVIIGGHFSKWNDGVYWEAMKAFAEEVCGKPQVQCVTFSELVNYLNTTGVPHQ